MRDDGVLFICDLLNTAQNGDMPKEQLVKISKHWFEIRTIGANRAYLAKGVNEQLDMLVRIELNNNVRIGQYCMLGNGDQYRITLVSSGEDANERTKQVDKYYYRQPAIVGLKYTELSLTRLESNYDVAADEDQGSPGSY